MARRKVLSVEDWDKPTVQFSIRLPKGLYSDLMEYSEQNNLSRSRVIATILARVFYSELYAERVEKEILELKKEILELKKEIKELSRRDK